MNTRAKGRKNELKAKRILEKQGYVVELTKSPSKWQKQQDLFGLWDIVAVNNTEVRFIQVKSNKPPYGKARLKYDAFRCPLSCSREIWVFKDRVKEPRIIYL